MATEVANLFVLPNQINGAVRALPEVQAISEIVRKLRDKFDYIVIDAAPVLGYPDTPLLAPVADGVLLVVAADATPLEPPLAARAKLERSGACPRRGHHPAATLRAGIHRAAPRREAKRNDGGGTRR